MAGFKTHLSGGVLVGVVGFFGVFSYGMASFWQSISLISLGALGAIIPDLDSDTGRPIKLLFSFVSSLAVLSILLGLLAHGTPLFTVAISCVITYIICLALFVICKRMTTHRGIMHSIPFTLFSGYLTAFLFAIFDVDISFLAGVMIFTGVMSHLILDELNSLGVRYGVLPYFKKSFGSALKFKGNSFVSTLALYSITAVIFLGYIIID